RATVEQTADHAGAQADATITFQKISQTLGFNLNPAIATTSDAPRTLSATATSGLSATFSSSNPLVASVSGNILSFAGTGTATITANQPGNDNYLAAAPVQQSLIVSTGVSFASLFPGQTPDSDIDGDGISAFVEYSLGGTSSGDDSAREPQLSLNGSNVILTAICRTNDPSLTIMGQWSATLVPLGDWTSAGVIVSPATDQNGVSSGFERRVFSVARGVNARMFMRLRFESGGNP
ncbi:MAG: hypothetical protein ABI600_02830, partial [Luteolibacter sp.]